jgi:hypothetical protein
MSVGICRTTVLPSSAAGTMTATVSRCVEPLSGPLSGLIDYWGTAPRVRGFEWRRSKAEGGRGRLGDEAEEVGMEAGLGKRGRRAVPERGGGGGGVAE